MTVGRSYLKKISLVNAALILLVAILLSVFVIQPVSVDTSPGVKHDIIMLVWGVNISMNIIIAYSIVIISLVKKGSGWMFATGVLMFFVFILAFLFTDAASAYMGHGPNMQIVVIILFICVAIEVIVFLLMLSTLIFRKKIMEGNFQNNQTN